MSRTDAQHLPITQTAKVIRAGFVVVLVLPIVFLALSVYPESGSEFVEAWRVFDRVAWLRLSSSVILGLWTTLFAVILAAPVYIAFLGASPQVRQWIVLLSLLPLSYPPFGIVSGWLTLILRFEQSGAGRLLFDKRGAASHWMYSQPGGGWLLALCFWPIVFLLVALSAQPRRSQVDAARLCLSHRALVRHVLWPAWREPLLIAASVIGCLCLLQFETPSLLQLRSYPLEIFTRFSIPENEWKALVLCLPYAMTALLFGWALHRAGRCLNRSSNDPPFTGIPKTTRILANGLTTTVFLLSVLIPLIALILHAGSWMIIFDTLRAHGPRLMRSIAYAGSGAIAIVLLGLAYTAPFPRRNGILAPAIFIALFACPGILIASGWLRLRSFWPGALPPIVAYLSLLGGYITHRMVLGYAAGVLLWQAYGERQREYETLLPLRFWTRLYRLYLPALLRPMSFAVILAALLLWGDIAITILLHPPGGDSLAVEYYNLLHYGNDARTASIGFLLLLAPALVMLVVVTIFALGRSTQRFYD